MITGIVVAIAKAMAIVGAGAVAGVIAIIAIAILAAPMGGCKLVGEQRGITACLAVVAAIEAAMTVHAFL